MQQLPEQPLASSQHARVVGRQHWQISSDRFPPWTFLRSSMNSSFTVWLLLAGENRRSVLYAPRLRSTSLLLCPHELGINTVSGKKRRVRAGFRDGATLENDDPIGVEHSAQPVGDHDPRAA